jgi:hypothetical protein
MASVALLAELIFFEKCYTQITKGHYEEIHHFILAIYIHYWKLRARLLFKNGFGLVAIKP